MVFSRTQAGYALRPSGLARAGVESLGVDAPGARQLPDLGAQRCDLIPESHGERLVDPSLDLHQLVVALALHPFKPLVELPLDRPLDGLLHVATVIDCGRADNCDLRVPVVGEGFSPSGSPTSGPRRYGTRA